MAADGGPLRRVVDGLLAASSSSGDGAELDALAQRLEELATQDGDDLADDLQTSMRDDDAGNVEVLTGTYARLLLDPKSGLLALIAATRRSKEKTLVDMRRNALAFASKLFLAVPSLLRVKSGGLTQCRKIAVELMKLDESLKVRSAALHFLAAVITAHCGGYRQRRPSAARLAAAYKDLNIDNLIQDVLLREYKTRQKSLGATVKGAILTLLGLISATFPAAFRRNPIWLADLKFLCVTTIEKQLETAKPELTLIEAAVSALDSLLSRHDPDVVFVNPREELPKLYSNITSLAATSASATRYGPQKSALHFLSHHLDIFAEQLAADAVGGAATSGDSPLAAKRRLTATTAPGTFSADSQLSADGVAAAVVQDDDQQHQRLPKGLIGGEEHKGLICM